MKKLLLVLLFIPLISCQQESKLSNDFEIKKCVSSTLKNLTGYGTDEFTVDSLINNSIKQLNRIEKFDIEIQKLKIILVNIQNDFGDLVSSLKSYLDQIENEDICLDDIQSRLFFLRSLETSFALNLTELIF